MSSKVSSGNTKDTAKDTRKSSLESTASKLAKLSREFSLFTQNFTNNVDNVEAVSKVNDYLEDKIYSLYVSLSGSDITGDGSQSNPFASVPKAIEVAKTLSNFDKSYGRQGDLRDIYYPDGITPLGTGVSASSIEIQLPVNPVIINVDEGLYEYDETIELDSRKYGIIIRGKERQPANLGASPNTETAINATYDTVQVDFNASGNTPWADGALKGLYFLSHTVGIFFGFSLGVIQDNTHDGGTNITTIKITRGSADLVLPSFTYSQANGLFTIYENVTEIRGLSINGINDSFVKTYNVFMQNLKLAGTDTKTVVYKGTVVDKCYIHKPLARTVLFIANSGSITTTAYLITSAEVLVQHIGNCYFTSGINYFAENITHSGFYRNNMRAFSPSNDVTEIICLLRANYYDQALIQASYFYVRADTHIQQIALSDSSFINGSYIDFDMCKMTIARCEFDENQLTTNVGFGAILYMESNSYIGASPLLTDYFINLEAGGQYIFKNGSCPVTGAVALGRINSGATTFDLGAGVRAFENGCLAQGV